MFGNVVALAPLGPAVDWLDGYGLFGVPLARWAGLLAAVGLGLGLGWLSAWPTRLLLRRLKARVPEVVWPAGFEHGLTAPVGLLVMAATVLAALDALAFPDPTAAVIRKACHVLVVATAALFVVRLLSVAREYFRATLTRGVTDASKVRSVATRVTVPIRIFQFIVWVAGAALVCLQFEAVQHLGVSILASAGVAGIVSSGWPPSGPSGTCWPGSNWRSPSRSGSVTRWSPRASSG